MQNNDEEGFLEDSDKEEAKVIDNFSGAKQKYTFLEGECFLKTKSDKFKKHYGTIMGNEIYCYRNKDDTNHRVMHCLIGTFIKEMSEETSPTSKKKYYPLKVLLPPNKSRIFYFNSLKD